ncbi:MAG: RimK-like ATPgrasp N-terminal domain-containing protein [Methanoregulaceae archaeon]|nr:RimK-like ATPgrasp N-terminal domain-containing protein [Methanoregulaceae archaeon]
MNGKKEHQILKDAIFEVKRGDTLHVISENYYYKTEPYYTILSHEMAGLRVAPASASVLDAYVIPICLEKAALAGIPVSEWGISHSFIPVPAVVYGLNYFATSSEFFVVTDPDTGKEVVKHITNKGKYPFCYQRLPEGASIESVISVFGRTFEQDQAIEEYSGRIYEIFGIPLVNMVFIRSNGCFSLSSLTPTRYTRLSEGERSLLQAYIKNQAFL